MTLQRIGVTERFDRWGHLAVSVVLVLAFVTGGGSSDRGIGDVLTQLLALPLIVWSMLALSASSGTGLRRAAIAVSLLVLATLAIQQMPLPEGLWRPIAVRDALANDLHAAGVGDARHVWSLSPLASERGLWSILPALAVFLGALAMPVQHQRRLLLLVVLLSGASLALGFLQLGAPQDSVLNPFPQWAPALNGVFANPNHQATALAVSVVIIAALLFYDWGREEAPDVPRLIRFGLIALAAFLFASLPLIGSRAVFLLAVLGLVAVPVVLRRGRRHPAMSTAKVRAAKLVLGLLAFGVIVAAVGWLQVDVAEEVRWSVARATAAMGWAHAPLGAGVGSFVPWFDQTAPAALIQWEYFNHAHNEYAQWWLESGVLGAILVLAVFAVLLACYPRRPAVAVPSGDRGAAVAAWLGCILMLLHSVVDYPLRTPALMAVAGLLAGIVVAQRMARDLRNVHGKSSLTSWPPQPA